MISGNSFDFGGHFQVQERFVLHFTDEEAVHYMQNLLESSQSAVMPALVDQFHKMAQVNLAALHMYAPPGAPLQTVRA